MITATCLIILGVLAAAIDARSRHNAVDDALDRVVTGLWRSIDFNPDEQAIDLGLVERDDLANGETAVMIVTNDDNGHWREIYGHLRSWLPPTNGAEALADDAVRAGGIVFRDGHDSAGRPVRLAATPIFWEDTDTQAVVLAGTNPGLMDRDRALLLWALIVGGLTLVALSGLAAHALSGRSMRQALALVAEQERFLGDAAHELRTPLTTLGLVTAPRRRSPQEVERALADAGELGAKMERIVAGLLARARMQAGVTTMERVQLLLDQLTESVIEEFTANIVVQSSPTVVIGDPNLLSLAVRNLIENALTHGTINPAAPVEVHVADGRVSVRDHGAGLQPQLSSNPFARGVTGGRGSGIGLALVAWIAELHGGTATMEPAPGGGAIATIALPPPTHGLS
ncbi:signal transduction histidine kinase [Nocardia tenerifensis]|uniref:histidine kinase n=1 Tax=Nocardia tenerifensis TaxID=228006 RepID=A0A318KSD6_9NOCA|nr:HAMP domain-containing sensor histidine kinase [Nocardia tenerifensis]PXX66387.1 signal transduction histidine kinase [Nocardia tenerifensis]